MRLSIKQSLKGPVLIHVVTQKERVPYAEKSLTAYGIGPFDKETGKVK